MIRSEMKLEDNNAKRVDFVVFLLFLFISIALAILAFLFGGVDFNVYYAAARVTLAGGNPYDFQQLAPQIISSAGKINNPYYYAPWFTWTVIPFALFPYSIARILWACFNFIIWLWTLYNLSKLIDYPQAGWGKWGMWLLVTFVFAWSTWGSEQVGILILFLFTFILLFAQRENWVVVGICLALILFKPNITALPVSAISIWFIVQKKEWKPLLVLAGTFVTFCIVSILITPNWYLALLQPDKLQGLSYTLDSTGATEIERYTTTLGDWLKIYSIDENISTIIYSVTILLGLIFIIYKLIYSKTLVEFSALAILVNFVIVPYVLFYDYPPLIITLFWGNVLLFPYPKFAWVRYLANSAIVIALFIGESIPYRYWITIILILFLCFGYFVLSFNVKTKENNSLIS